MKKIALIGLICLSVMGTARADEEFMDVDIEMDGTFTKTHAPCVSRKLDYQENQTASDDEFLHVNWDGGVGYKCDNEHCPDNYRITLFPGHTWEGNRIMETRTYKCNLGFNDKWEIVTNGYADPDVKRHGFRYCGGDYALADVRYPISKDLYTFDYSDNKDMVRFLSKKIDVDEYTRVSKISAKCGYVDGDGWTDIKIESCDAGQGYLLCNGKCLHYYEDFIKDFTDEQHESFMRESYDEHVYKLYLPKETLNNDTVDVLNRLAPRLQEYAGCKEAK